MNDATAKLNAALGDRYRFERELGSGGMATVYLAHDTRHDRPVAVKVLRPDLAAVIGVERFLAEIKTTANLQHAHILGLIDSGEVNGTVFYVMPFVDGESLRARLQREKQLPIPDAVRIASAVAGALDYAHRRGVVHRDIKPENIMLHEGQPLVADFGIALAVTRSGSDARTGSRMTETGMSLGTPQYMSPEQAAGERNLDARTDVYSLGCVLYEMLTGEPPFSGPTAQAIIAKVMSVEPEPVTTLRRSVPSNVAAATMTALNKVPADRFASTAEFAAALANPRYVAPEVAAQRAASRLPQLSTRELVGAAAIVALAIAAAVGWMRRGESSTGGDVAWLDVPVEGAPIGGQVHLSRDGSRMLWSASGGIWERRMDSLGARRVRDASLPALRDVSPDGREVLLSGNDRLAIAPLSGGPARDLPIGGGGRGGAAWGTDGFVYATFFNAIDSTRGIVRVRVSGGQPDTVATTKGGAPIDDILPITSRGLVVRRFYGIGIDSILSVDLTTNTWKTLAAGGPQVRYLQSGYLVFASGQYLMAAPFDAKSLSFTQPPAVFMEVSTGVSTVAAGKDVLLYRAANDPQGDVGIEVRSVSGNSNLIEHTPAGIRFAAFTVSPDGKRFVATGTPVGAPGAVQTQQNANLYVYTLPSGPMQRLVSTNADASPAWIPDTRDIAFVRFMNDTTHDPSDTVAGRGGRGGGVREKSVLMRGPWDGSADPTAIIERTRRDSSLFGSSTWFSGGRRAIIQVGGVQGGRGGGGRGGGRGGGGPPGRGPGNDFGRGGPGGGGGRGASADLMSLSVASTATLQPLLAPVSGSSRTNPALSPDGRLIAYAQTGPLGTEVYVSPLDGSARTQVSLKGGSQPKWSRSGTLLFFRNATSDTLFGARIRSGPEPTADEPRAVLTGASLGGGYGVLPGDSLFIMRPPATETPRPFIVVLNVTKELERLFAKK